MTARRQCNLMWQRCRRVKSFEKQILILGGEKSLSGKYKPGTWLRHPPAEAMPLPSAWTDDIVLVVGNLSMQQVKFYYMWRSNLGDIWETLVRLVDVFQLMNNHGI